MAILYVNVGNILQDYIGAEQSNNSFIHPTGEALIVTSIFLIYNEYVL